MVGLTSGVTLGFVMSDGPAFLHETAPRLTAALGDSAVGGVTLGAADDDADLLDLLAAAARPEELRIVTVAGRGRPAGPEVGDRRDLNRSMEWRARNPLPSQPRRPGGAGSVEAARVGSQMVRACARYAGVPLGQVRDV